MPSLQRIFASSLHLFVEACQGGGTISLSDKPFLLASFLPGSLEGQHTTRYWATESESEKKIKYEMYHSCHQSYNFIQNQSKVQKFSLEMLHGAMLRAAAGCQILYQLTMTLSLLLIAPFPSEILIHISSKGKEHKTSDKSPSASASCLLWTRFNISDVCFLCSVYPQIHSRNNHCCSDYQS